MNLSKPKRILNYNHFTQNNMETSEVDKNQMLLPQNTYHQKPDLGEEDQRSRAT